MMLTAPARLRMPSLNCAASAGLFMQGFYNQGSEPQGVPMPDHGFFHQALVYLAAGVIVVPVFKRLGLGSVLGYLIAGIAIGPWGLKLVSAPETILQFAEFGVVLLLFLVGLELNPKRVWQLRKPIFGMGAAQVLVTAAVVALAGWALGLAPKVALVVGMGFAMSSTAIGAFLAGVLLADSEYRHELELDIEPFKGLLLGLFFIAVGMSVDLGLFARSPLLIFLLVAAIVAAKILLLYPLATTFGYCGRADATLFALALSQVGEFAFVLFGAAGRILPKETLDILNASVAASMLSTPLLMMLYERVLAPRFALVEERAPDEITEQNPVIIAGFGRFGQVVSRVLRGMKIGATMVDHDPNQVDQLRRFGNKAYYGDATRLDLLVAAGARKAKLLVVAVDNPDSALQIVKLARRHFHHLKLIGRARSRTDAFEYFEIGVPAVRETFGSKLDAAQAALRALDLGP